MPPSLKISDRQVDDLLTRVERCGKYLVNPATKELYADVRGALYLVSPEGNPWQHQTRYGKREVAKDIVHLTQISESPQATLAYFSNTLPISVSVPEDLMREITKNTLQKSGFGNLGDIGFFSLMTLPTPGILRATITAELAFYAKK